jgi:hypothetical protein
MFHRLFKILVPFLFGTVLSFFHSSANAAISIAILDSDFCPDVNTRLIKIKSVIDVTSSEISVCNHKNIPLPRYHGQWVLDEFIKNYSGKENLSITPVKIFNNQGIQKIEYWQTAIDFIVKNKFDYVLSASGLKIEKLITIKLPAIWFVASGQITPSIKATDRLFPQELNVSNLYLIGDYHQGNPDLFDQSLLYQDKIKYYFPAGKGEFKGSSKAVAEALGKAISHCGKMLSACLVKMEIIKRDPILKKDFKTF